MARADGGAHAEVEILFERIVCAVDGTDVAIEAVRQVVHLAPPWASFLLVSVACPPPFADAAIAVSVAALEESAERALTSARAAIPTSRSVETRLLTGPILGRLRAELERDRATLLTVGGRRGSRAAGIVLGSVATALLHDVPCSILVAHRPVDPDAFPRAIAVGFDGSPEARLALVAGRELAARLGSSFTAVVARDGGRDGETSRSVVGELAPEADLLEVQGPAVEALADLDADLLIVGSRSLHGLGAVRSVSERVAHRARGSVLVVRAGVAVA